MRRLTTLALILAVAILTLTGCANFAGFEPCLRQGIKGNLTDDEKIDCAFALAAELGQQEGGGTTSAIPAEATILMPIDQLYCASGLQIIQIPPESLGPYEFRAPVCWVESEGEGEVGIGRRN